MGELLRLLRSGGGDVLGGRLSLRREVGGLGGGVVRDSLRLRGTGGDKLLGLLARIVDVRLSLDGDVVGGSLRLRRKIAGNGGSLVNDLLGSLLRRGCEARETGGGGTSGGENGTTD